MGLLILFASISIGASFLCSIWEAVLLSIPPSYVHVQQEKGTITGKLLAEYKRDIDRPLSAILSLNTIAHTLGAIGVGAVAATAIAHESAEAIAGVAMTLLILVASEIIPKTLGATYWKQLTPFTTRSLKVIILLLYPLVFLSQQITKLVKSGPHESIFSRADFTAMAEIGAKSGHLKENESVIISNLLRFEKVEVRDVMTPRTVATVADETTTIESFYNDNKELVFSRVPIFANTRDHISGFVLKDEVLASVIEGTANEPLKSIAREILVVPNDMPLPKLFEIMIEKQEHIAQAVDKFGGFAGIVTMEDVVETLLGLEIVDELDDNEDMQALARERWEQRARRIGILKDDVDAEDVDSATD